MVLSMFVCIRTQMYKDTKLVLKWDLENNKAMKGKPTKKLIALIEELQEEGLR